MLYIQGSSESVQFPVGVRRVAVRGLCGVGLSWPKPDKLDFGLRRTKIGLSRT
jgi:hypothetical protein